MMLIRKPEDLHKIPCNPMGDRFIFLLCFTEKRAVAKAAVFFYLKDAYWIKFAYIFEAVMIEDNNNGETHHF